MRLIQYINEDTNINTTLPELYELLKKDCKKYLKLLKGRTPLYRSMKSSNFVGIKKQRKNRRTQMITSLLVIVDKYLKEKNLPLRTESMICTSNKNIRAIFGKDAYFIFPKDNFKFAIIRSSDMNFSSLNWNVDKLSDLATDYKNTPNKKIYNEIISMLDWGIDGNSQSAFDEAYNKEYEMWFDCDEYYYVSVNDSMSAVANLIKRGK